MAVLTACTWFTKLAAYVTSARNPTYWMYLLGSPTVALGVYLAAAARSAGRANHAASGPSTSFASAFHAGSGGNPRPGSTCVSSPSTPW